MNVGWPRWSSTNAKPDRALGGSRSTSLDHVVAVLAAHPGGAHDAHAAGASASRSPASFERPYTDCGFGRVPLVVRPIERAVEHVVGADVDEVGADAVARLGQPARRRAPFTAKARSGSVSQASTAVYAAQWITASGRTDVDGAEHGAPDR